MPQMGKCECVLGDAGDLILGQRERVQMLQRVGKHLRMQLLQAIVVEVTSEEQVREREERRVGRAVEHLVCFTYSTSRLCSWLKTFASKCPMRLLRRSL